MNTNDQQFQKAYNELVTAFFNFMNVVSPQNSPQPNLSYIASQLNQLLNYLGTIPPAPVQVSDSDSVTIPESVSVSESNPISDSMPNPIPKPEYDYLPNPVVRYCAYPELTNGQYKFKGSALKEVNSDESSDERENYIYKLTIDEGVMRGYVELAELSQDQIEIISNNPTQYTPQDVCDGANNITPGKRSITSQSKLRLVKVVRGWVIAEGEKFILNVN